MPHICLGPKKYQKIARMYDRATRYASDCKNQSDLPYQEHSTPEADIPGYFNCFTTLLHQHFIDIVATFWLCHVRTQSFVTLRSLRFSSIPSPFLPKFLNVHNSLGHIFENVQVFQFFMPFRMVCSVLSEGGFWSYHSNQNQSHRMKSHEKLVQKMPFFMRPILFAVNWVFWKMFQLTSARFAANSALTRSFLSWQRRASLGKMYSGKMLASEVGMNLTAWVHLIRALKAATRTAG